MIQMIDPFCNPTGSVAKHISSVGLKDSHMTDSVILLGMALAMSEVGGLRKLLFHHS